ncbi:type VI secretion system protein TssR domain-containing protein [Portibacter marinus]|uniref:type VI secretion system protein TssR domain-containing protein n=1 Tax=Portibacter marinus TaxID=2898660 RepID=UPI001F17BBF8|nr:type VI secretion system protein TssR domain-containing protein [Portibacter marinus]
MKTIKFLTLVVFIFTFLGASNAQKYSRIMGKPEKFERPIDYAAEADQERFQNARDKYSKDQPWIVVSDRDNNPTYEKPDETSPQKETLGFKSYFYVVDEKEEWIHIIQARTSGLKVSKMNKDYGWVPKDKMLLWTSGLVDEQTRIHKKAFLLNKVKDIERILREDSKDFAKIYSGPLTNKIADKKTIYEFYFVYKKENDRYLLGKESLVSSSRVENVIVGWVDRKKAADWNTRIALEPNFDQLAFEERQNNPNFRVVGFTDIGGADGYARTGSIVDDKKAWDNDPIKISSNKLANSNPRRFKGSVVRFPMLKNYPNSFMSGAIGEIQTKSMKDVVSSVSEVDYSGIVEGVKESSTSRDNYNIFFLVEGTRQLGKYKQAVMNSLENLERNFGDEVNVRYGAAIYRDTPEEKVDKLFEIQPLVNDKAKVINFLNQGEFNQWHDNDEYTALYYALNETLLKGNFSDNHTNIIFLIGNNADYKFDRVRKQLAVESNDKTYIETDQILDNLAKINAHLVTVQCMNQGNRSCAKYPSMGASFIVEASKKQHREYSSITEYFPGAKIVNPSMPDIDEGNKLEMSGGPNVGVLFKPERNAEISERELQEFIEETIVEVQEFVEDHWEKMANLTFDGDAMDLEQSSGVWEPAIAREVYRLIQKRKENKSFSEEDLKKIIDQKYHLYREIYLAKNIRGAKNDAMSYVMFMPKEDLKDYIRTLKKLAQASDGSPDQQREALFLTFTELLKQFTGNAGISRRDVEQTSVDELRAIMQGIEGEGLVIGEGMGFKIGNILSPRKMGEAELEKLIQDILAKLEGLESIYRLGDRYEFSYSTADNTYFWIPVEYTL